MELLQELTFFVQGKQHTVKLSELSPETTLNTYLREHLNLTGTKRTCQQGGCGVCIVAVQRKNPITGKHETFAVNSCLVSIYTCYGWNIYTVEGIGDLNKPHQTQDVLAKFNGTQCGFCSPGMVMNMFSLQKKGEVTMKDVEDSFGGNMCRCTGYRPILAAFKAIAVDASKELLGNYPDIEEATVCNKACYNCDQKCHQQFYFSIGKSTWAKVLELKDMLILMKKFHKPGKDNIMLVAGNTAKGVFRNVPAYDLYIDVGSVKELINHEVKQDQLILGGNISLTEAMEIFHTLSKENFKFYYLKKLGDHIDLVANVPVRNIGSLAGNLMMKYKRPEFPSDVFLMLETAGAELQLEYLQNSKDSPTPMLEP